MRNVEKTMKGKTFIRNHIDKKLPPPTAARVWDRAHLELEMIYSSYRNTPPKVATHTDNFIFPAAAIYRALKKYAPEYAYEIMKTSMMEQSQKTGKSLARMATIPGFTRFFLSLWPPVSRKMFGETGYDQRSNKGILHYGRKAEV